MRYTIILLTLTALGACRDDDKPLDTGEPAEQVDADGDGYDESIDCDDADPAVNPGAAEDCNDVDDDCDGEIDEGTLLTLYGDSDGDGYGDPSVLAEHCEPETGWVDNAEDCDDSDAAVNPGAAELCNGIDDDCDGEIDEDDALDASTWYADADSDGYGDAGDAGTLSCAAPSGQVGNAEDCDDSDGAINPSATELCDGVDNDCDGSTDEDDALDASTWYADSDSDGYGDAGDAGTLSCAAPSGQVGNAEDCDDSDGAINPSATELCDGVDNDCDGSTDEDDALDASTWYADADADGYGDPGAASQACSAPSGAVADATDCDDGDAAVNPGAAELCNGIDDDCDGGTDEDDALDAGTWYADSDSDGYGDPSATTAACSAPSGAVADATDCDDGDAAVNPGATELCNGIDDDCDGSTDEDDALDAGTWYADSDSDGYGDPSATTAACSAPSGAVADATDCDDGDAAVNPGATELCNGIDDDCDGSTDEDDAADAGTWYTDADGDGYGDAGSPVSACSQPSGTVLNADDCDDAHSADNPDAIELLDARDNDCDGSVDEAIAAVVFMTQCLANDGHPTLSSAEATQAEADQVELYLDAMDIGMDRYDEAAGAGSGAALSDYEIVLATDCGWSWTTDNQALVDELLDARDLGIPTFLWGDDLGWSCGNVTGEEELTLMEGCYANGTPATLTMTGASHAAYAGPYGTPVDFAYANDMDQVSSWGGATVLAYSSAYGSGSPAWSAYEDSGNGSRAISLETSIYMSNHAQVSAAAEVELEIVFSNSVHWLLRL
jgi:hypothetical protein